MWHAANCIYIRFSDCGIEVIEAIETNNHIPFCHSETVFVAEYVSALADDDNTDPGVLSRNDLQALWEEYARPQKADGKLIGRCLFVMNGMISEILICMIRGKHAHIVFNHSGFAEQIYNFGRYVYSEIQFQPVQ